MAEQKRAVVMLIQRGDPQIGEALARGMLEGRMNAAPLPRPREQVEVMGAEAREDRLLALRVRVAVGNSKTAEDYRDMMIRAEGLYSTPRQAGPLHAVAGKLLVAWAMICQGIRRAYKAQGKVLDTWE